MVLPDSSALSSEAQSTLRTDSKWLQDNPGTSVQVEGHCDERGTNEYNLSYVNPANAYDSWNTASVTDITGAFKLYTGPGALGGSSPAETLADWSTDPTFGSLFNTDYEITGIGFNLGSYQRNALAYLDSTQTNLLNGGDVIDFQAVPEPASMALLGAGLLSLAMVRRRRKQG